MIVEHMTREQALARLREITKGITRTETESDDGWWETTTGAQFGAARLADLEALIRDLTA